MATVVPCVKGKFGSTNFYLATMKARELVSAVRPASELDNWAEMGIEERMQRDPNLKRIKEEIAPYVAKTKDRFFGAVIVLVYKGSITFETLAQLSSKLPSAYKRSGNSIGFVTIDGATLIVLDGQHRLLALEMVIKNDVLGPEADKVPNDDVSVIFIDYEDDQKTRRIFNKVNRYAKPTSRGDNIITSEDDTYAIVARHLLDSDAPFGKTYEGDHGKHELFVVWKHNTIADRSYKFTTISSLYETVKTVIRAKGLDTKHKLDPKFRPPDSVVDECYATVADFWTVLLQGVDAFKKAFADAEKIPDMREEKAKTSLLFKPAGQVAVVDALAMAMDRGVPLAKAVERLNKINWAMTNPMWKDIIIKPSGTIDVTTESREATAALIAYLISGKKATSDHKKALREVIGRRRGLDMDDPKQAKKVELPEQVKENGTAHAAAA